MTWAGRPLPRDDVEALAIAVEQEFRSLALSLNEIYATSIHLVERSVEPKRVDGIVVNCVGGVVWNGQNLTQPGWYRWNQAAGGGAGQWQAV